MYLTSRESKQFKQTETTRIHAKPHPSQTWMSYCWSRVRRWFKNIIQFNSFPSIKASINPWFIAWNLQEMQDLCVSVSKWGWQLTNTLMRVKESTHQVTMNRWEVVGFIVYRAVGKKGSASSRLDYSMQSSEIWMGCEIMCGAGPEFLLGPDMLTSAGYWLLHFESNSRSALRLNHCWHLQQHRKGRFLI